MIKYLNQALSAAFISRVQCLHGLTLGPIRSSSGEVARSWCGAPAPAVQLRSSHSHVCCTAAAPGGPSLCRVGCVAESASHFRSTRYFWREMKCHHRRFSWSSRSSTCRSTESGRGKLTEQDLKGEIDDLTDKFMETRELLEDAMEAKGTVYFNDDLRDAKESVQETLSQYEALMSKLSEEQERNVRRTIGLKMEELRAQEVMIDESLKE